MPILIKENDIFIFNNNFFYENWNNDLDNNLIEFILPLENIEVIQNINKFKNNLIDINIENLFKEYTNKNLALILMEENNLKIKKIYVKTLIQGKNISKSLNLKNDNSNSDIHYKKVIIELKKELVNLVKSRNLIDIRTPSFLNAKLDLDKNSNLVELKSRIKKIDLIENIVVQSFNKNYVDLKIKYLGKLEKIILQLKEESIELRLINEQWFIKAL